MATDLKLKTLPNLSVNDVEKMLTMSYTKLIKDNKDFTLFPSTMLWGQPGIGKSQLVRQVAKNLEEQTGKKVVVTDVRLLLFNPIDLRGIPVADKDSQLAIWLKPKIFDMDKSPNVVNILLLDEISAAPQSVQSAAYQITLDRKVGEHELPSNCIVIAAGNRVTDKSVAYKMPKALANRLLHFEITSNFESWKKWAIANDIHPSVIGFLNYRQDLLNTFDASNDALAFATPRSWEMVSNILNNISDKITSVYSLIQGLVGPGVAIEFKAWNTIYKDLPKAEDIFNGKACITPKFPHELFALSLNMIRYAKDHYKEADKMVNGINYVSNFPKDFAILFVEELINHKDVDKSILLHNASFLRLLNDKGMSLNGVTNGYF